MIWAVLAVVGVALIVWGVIASIRSNREADYRGGVEYWRDPPEISPASAARLLSIVQPDAAGDLQTRQMSSSVLSLADKRVIGVRPGPRRPVRWQRRWRPVGRDIRRATVPRVLADGRETRAIPPPSRSIRRSHPAEFRRRISASRGGGAEHATGRIQTLRVRDVRPGTDERGVSRTMRTATSCRRRSTRPAPTSSRCWAPRAPWADRR